MAQALKVPEATVRVYRDEFEEFLPAHGEGRKRRYEEGTLQTLRRIVAWKREGKASVWIRDELAREARPAPRVRFRNTEERLDEIAAFLRAQASEIAMLRVEVGALRAETSRLADAAWYAEAGITGANRETSGPNVEAALRERGVGREGGG